MKAEPTTPIKLETRLHILKQQYAKSSILLGHYLKLLKKIKKENKKNQNKVSLNLELLNYN